MASERRDAAQEGRGDREVAGLQKPQEKKGGTNTGVQTSWTQSAIFLCGVGCFVLFLVVVLLLLREASRAERGYERTSAPGGRSGMVQTDRTINQDDE